MTGQQIEDYVFDKFVALIAYEDFELGGGIYHGGERPFDSKREDCVISLLNADNDQIQEGDVLVNIYVPDIKMTDGMHYKNTQRCRVIEVQLQDIDEKLNALGDVRFYLNSALVTIQEEEIGQHFVSAKLHFKNLQDNKY